MILYFLIYPVLYGRQTGILNSHLSEKVLIVKMRIIEVNQLYNSGNILHNSHIRRTV